VTADHIAAALCFLGLVSLAAGAIYLDARSRRRAAPHNSQPAERGVVKL
jgi:hypothetical protein